MIECKKLETYTDDWITVAQSKTEDGVIATKKKLLEYCLKCEHQEECNDATKLYREITQ